VIIAAELKINKSTEVTSRKAYFKHG